jgi:hypothetical protein
MEVYTHFEWIELRVFIRQSSTVFSNEIFRARGFQPGTGGSVI